MALLGSDVPLGRSLRLLVVALVVAIGLAGSSLAQPAWDGTWAGGWANGDGVQIIVAGNKVIGVFRGGDYPDIQRSQVSADGRSLIFAWAGGDGTLQRTGERDAAFTLHEPGRAERKFPVQRE
jgi:hypothetical protein